MRKLLVLTILLGVVAVVSSSCSKFNRYVEITAMTHVLNERRMVMLNVFGITNSNPTAHDVLKAAEAKSKSGQQLDFKTIAARLRAINTMGCPQKFKQAWEHYIEINAAMPTNSASKAPNNPLNEANKLLLSYDLKLRKLAADRFPTRGPWMPAAEPPPEFAFTTEVLLANGGTTYATWTGALWWGFGAEVKPLGWRWVHNPGMSAGPKTPAAA